MLLIPRALMMMLIQLDLSAPTTPSSCSIFDVRSSCLKAWRLKLETLMLLLHWVLSGPLRKTHNIHSLRLRASGLEIHSSITSTVLMKGSESNCLLPPWSSVGVVVIRRLSGCEFFLLRKAYYLSPELSGFRMVRCLSANRIVGDVLFAHAIRLK